MKIVINACFGGFGLSPLAIKRLAELQGRTAYFFKKDLGNLDGPYGEPINPATIGDRELLWYAYDVPNPNEILPDQSKWHSMSLKERIKSNEEWATHGFNVDREDGRADPLLVQVVEELGAAASARFAKLKVVEIPDDVEWEIDEYDGAETVEEKHRSWS